LRVIRAFRSTLEDLNERRSMHSLHSLRSPRTGMPLGVGHPLYNFNLLSPNYNKHQHQQQQQPPPQQQHNQSSAPLPLDISYIDEDPQQQRTLHNGRTTSVNISGSASTTQSKRVPGLSPGFSEIAHTLQQQ
ncbi:Hypothetical predicted protein, partial [Drosophila guanche]